jgi:hypothetical protein
MTINEIASPEARIIAPKLRRIGNHRWAWVALGDLAEIFNQSATTLWANYCADARSAALADDWDGKPWKFAVPRDSKHHILDVWNMKTGEVASVSDDLMNEVLVPGGWSKMKLTASEQFEEALRGIFALIDERWTSAREMQYKALPAITNERYSDVENGLKAVRTFDTLGLVLAQIESATGGLIVSRSDNDSESSIFLSFTNPAPKQTLYPVHVNMNIRTVLGQLKLLNMHGHVNGMY